MPVIELQYEARDQDECDIEHYDSPTYYYSGTTQLSSMFSMAGPRCLSGIAVRNRSNEAVQSFSLSYSYSATLNKYFLASLYDSRNGRHFFSYNTACNHAVTNNTNCLDYWGYYNGVATADIRSSLRERLNQLLTGSHYGQLFISSMQPDFQKCSLCGLTSVTYPTGGSTQIEYEANTASCYFERCTGHNPSYIANSAGYSAGGVRVKKTTNNDGSASHSEEYLYQNSRTDTSSSGYVLDTRSYGLSLSVSYRAVILGYDGGHDHTTASIDLCGFTSDCNLYAGRNPHVGYRTVLVRHPDNSMTEYGFSVGDEYIDGYLEYNLDDITALSKTFLGSRDTIYGEEGQEIGIYNLFLPPIDDNSCMRGKLLREVIYDADGHTMRRNTYQYSKELVCETTAYYNMLVNFVELTQKHYQCLGTSELEEEYLGNGVISRSRAREYNQSGQVKSETSTSGSESAGMHYWYVHETDSTRFPALRSDAVRTRRINDSTCVVSSEHYTYGANGGDYRPTMIESYIITPTKYTGSAPSVSTGRTAECRVTTLAYDPTYRRLTTVSMPGGAYVQYSWDSTYDHLTGKTVNGVGNTYGYMWKDMVGLTSLGYPAGMYQKFTYDAKNRLRYIMDQEWQVEKEYDYHLTNE